MSCFETENKFDLSAIAKRLIAFPGYPAPNRTKMLPINIDILLSNIDCFSWISGAKPDKIASYKY